MKPSYNNIELIQDKDKHDVAEILRSDTASIHNAHCVLHRDDGREHPYVFEVATNGDMRFYQLSKFDFQVILRNFDVNNKIID